MNPLKAHATAFRALSKALQEAAEVRAELRERAVGDLQSIAYTAELTLKSMATACEVAADALEAQIPTLAEGSEVTYNPRGKKPA